MCFWGGVGIIEMVFSLNFCFVCLVVRWCKVSCLIVFCFIFFRVKMVFIDNIYFIELLKDWSGMWKVIWVVFGKLCLISCSYNCWFGEKYLLEFVGDRCWIGRNNN